MQGAFIQALTYRPPAILGRQLLPFSPWHGIVLEGAGSPYIIGGTPDFGDFITAAWVCSHSFTHGWEGTLDLVAAKKWGKDNQKHRAQFPAAVAALNDHIMASFVGPEYWPADGGSSVKAPYWGTWRRLECPPCICHTRMRGIVPLRGSCAILLASRKPRVARI